MWNGEKEEGNAISPLLIADKISGFLRRHRHFSLKRILMVELWMPFAPICFVTWYNYNDQVRRLIISQIF